MTARNVCIDIMTALDGALAPRELGIALRFYTGNVGYLRAMLCGAWRVDLSGNVASTVTADEEAHARAKLAAATAKAAARKQAQKTAAQPKRDGLAPLRAAAQARKAGVAAS
jgi:sRNA-binding protein